MTELALLGGKPLREKLFPAYRPIGEEERAAVDAVMRGGVLSRFLGAWHDDFYGGDQVRAFEARWAEAFAVKHAVSVNSATGGLYAAVGATAVGPGDEVIVSPYTMIASATAALIFNAVPVFADIDPHTFTLDPASIEARITPRTRAIVVVHIFGQAADMDPIMALAKTHKLKVIEDCAQAPFATYKGRPVGALGDIGVFSLNYHKHIHTGEGGVVTTNDDDLAERVRLIRNHGEAVVGGMGRADLVNMVGFNFRLGELEAAIGQCQLDKGPGLIAQRRDNVAYLEGRLKGIPGLTPCAERPGDRHVYYVHPLLYDADVMGVSRETFVAAVKAELPASEMREKDGPLIGQGYVRPLYLEPIFRERIAYGGGGCPFTCPHYDGVADYREGLCPVCEDAHARTLITHELMRPGMTRRDLDDVADAFHKVADARDQLRAHDAAAG
ncbi:DegT/DnrJ/EryC1/StrS family aminotransferase [Varunaivibrio sulfuroxidans]|uniref:dTDP-4-amino-4,6-dideoxygalactose transaminase n=1 Tax=Varunaivibrio sulfuroxidans TaxID=1773489 RepID=A0A4R3JBJ2_9PROT|nr:DegT/DnrJ/EryC1/StrS family aminotransferase [Varunaivibrio sulfuroxidans]TCS62997.1 dTDP-4-amino-4,6-dideoxygalactose transaminase [Varunaivibrio sulfuroxidans]WES31925.1 DegT/DnrJ/EryC1/StrS family aminotransferase [Varunaivibrio sulfuroxidans]